MSAVLLAVEQLADVVRNEPVATSNGGLRPRDIVVEAHSEHPFFQHFRVQRLGVGLPEDGNCRDDNPGAGCDVAGRFADFERHIRELRAHLGDEALGACRVQIVKPHTRQPGQRFNQSGESEPRLHAAAKQPGHRRVFPREILRGDSGARARAHSGDPGGVHHGDGNPRLRVAQDQQAADVRQPLRRVGRVAADPLHTGDVHFADIRRHRVHHAVVTGIDARLGRHLRLAQTLKTQALVHNLQDLFHCDIEALDVVPAQVYDLHLLSAFTHARTNDI